MFDGFEEFDIATTGTTIHGRQHARIARDQVEVMRSLGHDRDAFPPEIRTEYIAKCGDPSTVHAICEEYRASSTLDRRYDEADRGRRRIACPTLVPWSDTGPLGRWYEPLDVWKTWADDVDGGPVSAGHFIPEATPDETARRLFEFLK